MTIETLARQGRTDLHNGLASIDTAKLKKIRNAALRDCFSRLDEMRFRREFVARIHNKNFINDSASRNVNSAWYSLESADGPVVWILNSTSEPVDYSRLVPAVQRSVKMIVCIGHDDSQIRRQFASSVPLIYRVDSLHDAVQGAFYSPFETITVLFSPVSYNGGSVQEEGELFQREVNDL